MPDLAENIVTGEVLDARELAETGSGLDDPWRCPGCNVRMKPIACGEGPYKVSPHFRSESEHKVDCDIDGLRKIVVKGRVKPVFGVMAMTDGIPTILNLVQRRPQRPSTENEEADAEGVLNALHGRGNNDAGTRRHEATASTIRRIAEAYCGFPDERGRRLKIPGCEGNTYASCFQRLRHTKLYVRFSRRVMFAPIRFSRPQENGGITVMELDSVVWPEAIGADGKWHPLARYRLALPTGDWSARSRNRFSKDLEEARNEQRDSHNEGVNWKVFAFFLGDQSEDDLAIFKVTDHRLICFLTICDDVLSKMKP